MELILVRLTILGVSFGLLAFESREMPANFIGRKHTSHFGDKRGSSLAKAGCSVAALAKFTRDCRARAFAPVTFDDITAFRVRVPLKPASMARRLASPI